MVKRLIKKRKGKTLTGQRIPISIKNVALQIQTIERGRGRRKSLQDVYREMARRLKL